MVLFYRFSGCVNSGACIDTRYVPIIAQRLHCVMPWAEGAYSILRRRADDTSCAEAQLTISAVASEPRFLWSNGNAVTSSKAPPNRGAFQALVR